MAKFLQTYASDGSVQEIIQLPASLELLLDNAADLPVNFATPTRQTFSVVEGASANAATWVAPFKCRVVAAGGYKTQNNGGAGDMIELVTATGPANIVVWNLNVNDTFNIDAAISDVIVDVDAGQTLTIHRTQLTKAGGDVWFDVMPA